MSKKQSALARRLAAKEAQILASKDTALQQELIKTNLSIYNNLESTNSRVTETKNTLNYNLDPSISDSLISTVNKKDRYKTTSTTSINLSSISTFSITVETELSYTAEQTIVVAYNTSNYFFGIIKSYDPETGIIQGIGTSRVGSGTYASWTVNLSSQTLSAGSNITIVNGQISSTGGSYTDAQARNALSVVDSAGDGSLSYSSSTGVFTYTGPSASEVRAHFSAGSGISISSGQISTLYGASSNTACEGNDSRLISDGTRGDITVSNSNATWTVNNSAITTSKLGGDITTAGKALLDDADAAAQRETLSASRQNSQRYVELFDDLISPLAWNAGTSGTGAARSTASAFNSSENTVGMVVCATGTTTTGRSSQYDGDESLWFGNGWTWMLETRACVDVLADATNDYAVYLGFCDNNAVAGEPNDGAYFKYVRSVTNTFWVATTANNGTRTTTVTAIAPTVLVMQVFRINVNEAANSVEFRIDGNLVATHNTNIPTASARSTGIGQKIQKSAGTTSRSLYIDYIHLQGSRNTDR